MIEKYGKKCSKGVAEFWIFYFQAVKFLEINVLMGLMSRRFLLFPY
jgi:hypothetical protein